MTSRSSSRNLLYTYVTGICMGAADVVPGVSGGTIAFVMGIYEDLLGAVKSINLEFFRALARRRFAEAFAIVPWSFLCVLAAGIATAILSLAKGLEYLLEHHQIPLMAFFFGLIAASVGVLAKGVRWSPRTITALIIGSAFAFWLVGLVPSDPGHSLWILFGSGMLTICATILPGISGSFILLILGQYSFCVSTLSKMIDAVKSGDFSSFFDELISTILPLAAGAILGMAVFCRLLSWLLARFASVTIAVLTGFMVGSLRRIWPFKDYDDYIIDRHGDSVPTTWTNRLPEAVDSTVLACIGLCFAGFLLIIAIDYLQSRFQPESADQPSG